MNLTPEPAANRDFADQVELALQALWGGDSSAFERLVESEPGGDGPRLGWLIENVCRGIPSAGREVPSEIGGYRIVREIGRGGMGVVYEAAQKDPARRVALKVLPEALADDYHTKLFRREIEVLAKLRHPGIATIYHAGQSAAGQHFFTMELVEGVSLDDYLQERDVLLRGRLELFVKISAAVEAAHQQGVIHRDLKPSNILVSAQGDPKILDFGLARRSIAGIAQSTLSGGTGRVLGSVPYMSPEQARGRPQEMDARSDVYALGVILYELLTGQPPYDLITASPVDILRIICERPPRRPSTTLGPDGRPARQLRGDLETIVLKALEKDPARRYLSAGELGADIQRYLESEPIHARRSSIWYVARKTAARHRWACVLAALALSLGGIAISLGIRARALGRASARYEVLDVQRHLEASIVNDCLERIRSVCGRHAGLPEAWLLLARTTFENSRRSGDAGWLDYAGNALRQQMPSPARWAGEMLWAEIQDRIARPAGTPWVAPLANQSVRTAEDWYVASFATFDPHEAKRRAQAAVDKDADHTLAWERLLYLSVLTDDPHGVELARRELKRRSVQMDDRALATYHGHALLRQGHYAEARDAYSSALGWAGGRRDPWECRATARLCLRDYAGAIDDYKRAEQNQAADNGDWIGYRCATPLWITGRTDDAVAAYRKFRAARRRTSYADARLFLVLNDQARALPDRQEPDAAQALIRAAEAELAVARRGVIEVGLLAKSLDCLSGALTPEQLVPAVNLRAPKEECEASYYAGEVCRLRGQLEQARRHFEQCQRTGVVFDPDSFPDPLAEYHLARWRLDQVTTADRNTTQIGGD